MLQQLCGTKWIIACNRFTSLTHQYTQGTRKVSDSLGLLGWAFTMQAECVTIKPSKILGIDFPYTTFYTAVVFRKVIKVGKMLR